jgi:site-specific DNA-methyltransferase (adenine-specific)
MYTLIHGDCLEEMDKLISSGLRVSCIITDPPYGTVNCPWDCVIPFPEMWDRINNLIEPDRAILLFSQQPFTSTLVCSNLQQYKYSYYWEKERITNIFQVKKRAGKVVEEINVFYTKNKIYNPQMVSYSGKKVSNKIKDGKLGALVDASMKKPNEYEDTGYRYPTQCLKFKRDILVSNLHPTQKPLALMEHLVKTYTNEGDIVLDFTMGSGTTGLACLNTNRSFIGIEKDEKYFNIAKERLKNAGYL